MARTVHVDLASSMTDANHDWRSPASDNACPNINIFTSPSSNNLLQLDAIPLQAGESDLQNVVIPAHRMIEPIPWDIKADISQGVPPILHGLPIKPYKAEKSPQPLINPADVQHSKAVRQNAWERCCLEASKNESQVAALEAVYK